MMHRFEIINKLIEKYDSKRYLEIGIRHFECLNNIKLPDEDKQSIDPNYDGVTYKLTSDEAFESMPKNEKWDIIFIDGLHEFNQVLRDIENSLEHLNENGTIVCHDMLPHSENMLALNKCGNGWEAFAHLRMTNKKLEMYVINSDNGCGVIRRGTQNLYEDENFSNDWGFFKKNKKLLMNVKSTVEFMEQF